MDEIVAFDRKIQQAKLQPPQRRYCGDYIRENELTLLFAPTSFGKSVLAMTLAIGISTGAKQILSEPNDFENPQTCLYLDFEMSDQQLLNRYANCEAPRLFSMDIETVLSRMNGDFLVTEDDLVKWISQVDAKVLIVDNLGAMISETQSHTQAKEIINMLWRLTRTRDITIILIQHATKSALNGSKVPINISQSEGSYKLSAYADHVLGLGKSPNDELYLRHLKSRNGQPQDLAKLINIESEPYIYATAGDVVELSELFPNDATGDGTPARRSIDYKQLTSDLFISKNTFAYMELVRSISELIDCKESASKYHIKKMIEENYVIQDGKTLMKNQNEFNEIVRPHEFGYVAPLNPAIVEIDVF